MILGIVTFVPIASILVLVELLYQFTVPALALASRLISFVPHKGIGLIVDVIVGIAITSTVKGTLSVQPKS